MKDCPEIDELLKRIAGDEVVGFFERKLSLPNEDVLVFIPVYSHTKSKGLVN